MYLVKCKMSFCEKPHYATSETPGFIYQAYLERDPRVYTSVLSAMHIAFSKAIQQSWAAGRCSDT